MHVNRTYRASVDEDSRHATATSANAAAGTVAGAAAAGAAAASVPAALGRRAFLAGALSLGMAGALSACAGGTGKAGSTAGSSSTAGKDADKAGDKDEAPVRVASLKGPTSMGLVAFMQKAGQLSADAAGEAQGDARSEAQGEAQGDAQDAILEDSQEKLVHAYDFQMMTAADQIMPAMLKGEIDIALLPANAASVLYAKSKGAVRCLNINTLGVLSVVTGDPSVRAFEDLAGRTVYLTGKGTTPEYVMNFLLDAAGIEGSVALEFKSEPAEVISVLAADAQAVGVLPQPFVTAAQVKNTALAAPVDLTQTWERLAGGTGSQLLTGVTVARAEFADKRPDAVDEFMRQQSQSVDAVNADPAAAAKLVVAAGIVEAEPVAAKAIPACHLTCIEGAQMHDALEGYLDVLYSADPASVGGAMPGDDFYYQL